jgi:hypothetical protein
MEKKYIYIYLGVPYTTVGWLNTLPSALQRVTEWELWYLPYKKIKRDHAYEQSIKENIELTFQKQECSNRLLYI